MGDLSYIRNEALTQLYGAGEGQTGKAVAVDQYGRLLTASSSSSTSPVSSTASSPTFATVGTSTGQILAADANRKGVTLVNDSANIIYLAFGASAVVGRGIRLNANGGSFTMQPMTFTTQAINAIATGASSNITVQAFT